MGERKKVNKKLPNGQGHLAKFRFSKINCIQIGQQTRVDYVNEQRYFQMPVQRHRLTGDKNSVNIQSILWRMQKSVCVRVWGKAQYSSVPLSSKHRAIWPSILTND